jgi:dolichyl-phosphate-mannose--protein O-mannosyl transferase
LPVYLALKYFNYEGKRAYLLEIAIALSVGAAVSVKWLALSVVPVVAMLVIVKKVRRHKTSSHRKLELFRNLYNTLVLFLVLPFTVYLASYYWHFSMIHTYAPAADEVTESFLYDLKNGTDTTPFMTKFWDAQQLNLKYEKYVPKLDLTKKDEIGSMWVTWPLMARPIDYYHETSDGGETYAFAYMIGNPFVWYVGLLSILVLMGVSVTGILVPELVKRNQIIRKNVLLYFSLVMLFLANWLPYALITRVMYLYHYLPAVAFLIIGVGVTMSDLVIPRLGSITGKVKGLKLSTILKYFHQSYFFSFYSFSLLGMLLLPIYSI